MRILLDTHCWLWMQVSPEKLSAATRALLSSATTELYLSAASSWEIAIKWSLGKLPLPEPPVHYVPGRMARQGGKGLPVLHHHTLHMANLPIHHRDPFDRLLIAQAQVEKLHLLTADGQLAAYQDVEILWA